MPEIAAMDFVTIPTASFKVLYCLFIIHHDRRRILHFNVTANPTAAWVHQQLREVFPEEPHLRYLVHDRDSKFAGVTKWLISAGAKSVLTSYRSPWQNGIAERWVLTLRRELLDHVVVFNEAHARRLIADFVAYYNEDRCHLSLNKDSPEPRPIQARPPDDAQLIAIPESVAFTTAMSGETLPEGPSKHQTIQYCRQTRYWRGARSAHDSGCRPVPMLLIQSTNCQRTSALVRWRHFNWTLEKAGSYFEERQGFLGVG